MGIDRDTSGEPDPRDGSSPSAADASDPSRSGGPGASSGATQEYGYGAPPPAGNEETPPTGTDGAYPVPPGSTGAGYATDPDPGRGADSGATPEGVADHGIVEDADSVAAGNAPGQGPRTSTPPASGLHPETGLRPGTAPRAVLRPVPEGFPTPPPRPARPNRRPAPKTEADPDSRRPRVLIASLAVVAALILVVAIGGSILAYRALSPDPSEGAAPEATADGGDSAAGEVAIGEVTVREVSTEPGVQSVGDAGAGAVEAEGEFVVVTLEVDNATDATVSIDGHETLRTADGETYETDSDASRKHIGEGKAYGTVGPGESATFHLVYDVPIGSEPAEVEIDFAENASAGDGILPLGG
ncbi:DUF4352 domain-containing protein [Brachybacterium sacelli]|uniref:DUF4352 domain-containing protein n=1 Tax=Brachybacterium sacelli TaxID=173364 RepID=A0ABS4X4P8_9MICO|nr:hypothetical protein [Brachybacterium sacelli]